MQPLALRAILYCIIGGIGVDIAIRALAEPNSYVTPEGSVAPERDDPTRPWQLVEAAARALPAPGGTVIINPGTYRESFFLNTPVRLTAPRGGVFIGSSTNGVVASTTFNVFTWNTHLFGDTVGASWQDYERAEDMANRLARPREQTDLVSLCEVWDEDLFFGGDGAKGIIPLSGYVHGVHGTRVGILEGLNSGLAMMCNFPLASPMQIDYEDCSGSVPIVERRSPDCRATKGFISATVVKDGFTFRVYNTHTQSGNDPPALVARHKQLLQIATDINGYREANPTHVVFVMGDLNVIGESEVDYELLRGTFGSIGGRDAARNAAHISMYNDHSLAYTLTSFNRLALHFDPNPYDQRLDYVWYFPSRDGKISVHPTYVDRVLDPGMTHTEDGFTSDQFSDHYPIRANFRIDRTL
jgi:endonuclease/exonuclease/phosphatase family metal-dependent hydrolase